MITSLISSCRHNLSKELDDFLAQNIRPGGPGAAILVVENGEVRYQGGAGLANLETRRQITPQTTFRMASVSKQFTAMGILLLEKEGKLTLNDTLLDYFPRLLPTLADSITLKHLLTHTSGIPDYESLLSDTMQAQVRDEDIPALLETQERGYFEPGTKFRYSNTGFCLLALIVQKVSGMPYAQFMQDNIFGPLGMRHTSIYDPNNPVPDRGMGYARDKNGNIVASDRSPTSATKGDGCVYTNLEDYLKWYNALRENRFVNLPQKLSEASFPFRKGLDDGYGLGWFFANAGEHGGIEMTHSGSTCGFSNVVFMSPGQDFLIAYFSNLADNHAAFEAIQNIVDRHASYHPILHWNGMHKLTN